MIESTTDLINCPLCDLAHRAGAVTCDGCGQALHEKPNLDQMRTECALRKRNMILAVAAIVGMLVLNVALVGHVGGFVIATAPLGWFLWSLIRFRALNRKLARFAVSS